jgi:multicomponent Na+:H+ antiporter subunit D
VSQLLPLLVVVPLATATLLAGLGHLLPRPVADAGAIAMAAASAVAAGWLVVATRDQRAVAWIGGWRPRHGESVGIALVADGWSAVLMLMTAVVVLAGLVFSWRYLEETSATYHALTLVFLGSVSGFLLAGDLFDAFVWLELSGVAAYALAGMRVEEPESVHAALEFAVINTLGGSCALVGVSLLYARTGELDLALVGEHLRAHPADPLVAFAFALLLVGALVKAAVVPLHFWTADTEAAAPSPVCGLLSGAMVAMGGYAVARWWWVGFDGVLSRHLVEPLLVGLGALTAVVGAVLCVQQRHVKRLLAYSTISHSGVALLGVGLLDEHGFGAAAAYLVGHACVKVPLFLASGVLLNRFGSVDEHDLAGRGRGLPATAAVFAVGGLGLAGIPALGLWWGKAALEHTLSVDHLSWLVAVVVAAGALTGGAVLRATARVFLGWGATGPATERSERSDESEESEEPEESPPGRTATGLMLAPAVVLLALGAVVALVPWVRGYGADAAALFTDRHGYVAAVLGRSVAPVHGYEPSPWTVSGLLLAAVAVALAVAVAAWSLWGPRIGALATVGRRLHRIHRAPMPEQVGWLLAGTGVIAVWLVR